VSALPAYLAPYAGELRTLHREVAADRYQVATGQQAAATPAIYDRFPRLTDGRLVRAAIDRGDHAYAVELAMLYLRVALREATDRLRRAQTGRTVEFAGRPHTHGQLVAAARTCRDEAERAAVRTALARVSGQLREERLRWLGAYGDARARLGFASNGAFIRALHPDVDAWVVRAQAWLDDTRAGFLRQWDRWCAEDGIAEPRLRDVLAVGSAPLPDGVDGHAAVRATMGDWGFSGELGGVRVDLEARPGKVPMSFCSPVDPPHDVRLSTVTPRLLSDVVTTLHEYAHAAHFAVLSDITAAWGVGAAGLEAVGLAVEQVALRPDWIGERLRWRPDDTVVRRHLFRRAALRRLVTASLVYEMGVHDEREPPETAYQRIFPLEFRVVVDPIDAYTRLQTYLEAQPCYPLIYTKAYTMADGMYGELCGDDGTDLYPHARTGDRLRSLLRCTANGEVRMPAVP
jgi:hypothetical protein